jgi:uncharacterized C2H2 Zn-finger protein
MGYECPRCHYSTESRHTYISHLNKQKTCPPTYNDVPVESIIQQLQQHYLESKKHKCTECNKCFSYHSGLSRHMKTHVTITNSNNTSTSHSHNTDSHNIENHTHSHNIENHTHSHNTTNNNNTTINQPININQPITINVFGKEDLTHVVNDKEFLTNCLKDVLRDGIPNLIEKIYLNPDIPENHNIRLKTAKYPPVVEVIVGKDDRGQPIVENKDAFELYEYIIRNKGTSLLVVHKDELFKEIMEPNDGDRELYGLRTKRLADINTKKKGVYGGVRNGVHAKFRTARMRERPNDQQSSAIE